MTAEQLEELLAVIDTQDGQSNDYWCALHKINSISPSLARKVIAAEQLVDGLGRILNMGSNVGETEADELDALIAAYRDASK